MAVLSSIQTDDRTSSIQAIGSLACSTEPIEMRCNFSVSNQAWQQPKLSFVLKIPVRGDRGSKSISMPSIDSLYFQLNDPHIQVTEVKPDEFWARIVTQLAIEFPSLKLIELLSAHRLI